MNKKLAIGIALIAFGVITVFLQIYYVRETGKYWLLGAISSAFIVLGIASFFVDLKGFEDQNGGPGARKSFGDLPGSLKAVLVLALLAGVAHAAAFELGIVMM